MRQSGGIEFGVCLGGVIIWLGVSFWIFVFSFKNSDSFLHVKIRLTIAVIKEQMNCRRILAASLLRHFLCLTMLNAERLDCANTLSRYWAREKNETVVKIWRKHSPSN